MNSEFQKQLVDILTNQQRILDRLTANQNLGLGNGEPSSSQQAVPAPKNSREFIIESLSNGITDFVYDPENGVTFEAWFSRYEDLFSEDAKNLDDAAKVRLLLRNISTVVHQKYVSYILPVKPKEQDFKKTVETLKSIFGRQTSLFNARYQCLQMSKNQNDDFFTYAGIVNQKCENFKLAEITPAQFKCLMFVCGLNSHRDADVRTTLLSRIESSRPDTEEMTVHKLAAECQRLINLKRDTAMVEKQVKQTVCAVSRTYPSGSKTSDQPSDIPKSPCWRCGEMHYSKHCSFVNHECRTCKKTGHKEGYCACFEQKGNNKKKDRKQRPKTQAQGVFTVNQVGLASRRKFITVGINGVAIKLQLDCASDITIIPEVVYIQLGSPAGKTPSIDAVNASGEEVGLTREIMCSVSLNGTTKTGRCFVTSVPDLCLFGIEWMELFNLWDVPINAVCNGVKLQSYPRTEGLIQGLQEKFQRIFSDQLGLCKKKQVQLTIKSGTKPIFRQKRPVPYASAEKIETELDRLQQLGIITPVSYSEWAAPIVAVNKPNGRVRICADYSTGLNSALEPHQHPLPLPQDIFAKLANKKVFSQIDLSDAYLQVEVEPASRKLLTINTHKGLFEFTRLSPGVKTAPGAFQEIVDNMISGLEATSAYLDDLIVASDSVEEHVKHLECLFSRISEYGFTLKIAKSNFFMGEIKYLGFIIDRQGLRPDPEKVRAISEMPAPHDVTTLRSFLGAVNYYSKFVRGMHELRRPLDALLKKDVKWNWSALCQQSFNRFKQILQSNLLLTHYDPRLEIIVAADASKSGVAAVLMHRFPNGNIKAVCHASRTMTQAEKGYSQGEKEALALIFAVTKFHRMLFGRQFMLQTDHKPLVSIFGSKKGIPVHTANRLQRWALTMLLYDFKIEFKSTDSFGYADVLSRLIDQHSRPEEEYVIASTRLEASIRGIQAESLSSFPITHEMVVAATRKDRALQKVLKQIEHGWTSHTTAPEVKPFQNRRESLYESGNCVMFLDRIVIPEILRSAVLKQLHAGHPGMERMKAFARSYVFWPSIDSDIEDYVRRCSRCAAVAKSPIKTTLSSWPIPSQPFSRVHMDYAGPFKGKYFLVIVDALTKWPEIYCTSSMTASVTISKFQETTARFGMPDVVVTDNGTQFDSSTFKGYCDKNGIEHIRIPPFHSQSNGQAERFVDTLKRALKKMDDIGIEDALQTFLYTYRYTPNKSVQDGKSPAEAMIGRKLRTSMDLLRPSQQYFRVNTQQDEQYNRAHSSQERWFKPGDEVYAEIHIRNERFWAEGRIIERKGSVTYNVFLDDSRRRGLIRSHTNQLRPRYSGNPSHERDLPFQLLLEEFGIPATVEGHPEPTQPIAIPEEEEVLDDVQPNRLMTPEPEEAQDVPPEPEESSVEETPVRGRTRKIPSFLKDYLLF